MGYTEIKNKKIIELQHEVNVATKDQAKAQADATAKANTLSSRTAIYEQDQQDAATSKTNLKLSETVLNTADSTHTVIKIADETTEHLYLMASELVNMAYDTALKTVNAAKVVSELSNHIEKTKTKNKLISDLLVQDAKKATADAAKAVTDATAALNNAITAATLTIHLTNSLTETEVQVNKIAVITGEKKDGLNTMLDDIYQKTLKKTEHAREEKEKSEEASNEANKRLSKESSRLTYAIAALAAANAAAS